MKQCVNKNLVTLKCVLFCFLSGVGCIFPFLPLHMLSLGLDRGEARLISAVAPCIALLGPALLGPFIDKLSVGRGSTGGAPAPSGSGRLLRITTAVCLILSALFYTLLLTIPAAERHEARRPNVLFMCDENSAYVMQEVCKEDMRCNRWSGEKSGVIALTSCEYGCADDNMTWVKQPFAISEMSDDTTAGPLFSLTNMTWQEAVFFDDDNNSYEEFPPHLCYNGLCTVYMQHEARLRLPLSLLAPGPPEDNTTSDAGWCTYRTSGASKCVVPPQRLRDLNFESSGPCRPAVRCLVLDPYDEPDGVLADAECRRVVGDPAFTFTTYFILRVLADIWPIAALALLGAACVIATRETSLGRGDVGRQLAFGTLGLAIFPPLAGLAADSMPDNPFLVPFIMHAVFMLIGALILLIDKHMPLSTPEWWWHTATGALALPFSAVRRYGAETAAVFAVVTLLGVLWSGIDSYLPWTIKDIYETATELNETVAFEDTATKVGLTLTVGALPAVPALLWAEALVDYIGHSNVFITAFIFYCLRYTGLAYGTDYNWIVVCEILEIFTLSLVWVTAMLYFRHLVPRKYTATGQALPVIAHFCIGRCIGAIIGGMVRAEPTSLDSQRGIYRALGVVSLLAAAIYLALYHLLLAPRCAAQPVAPPQHLLQDPSYESKRDRDSTSASNLHTRNQEVLTYKESKKRCLNANGGSNGTYSPMRVYHEERSRKGHFRY